MTELLLLTTQNCEWRMLIGSSNIPDCFQKNREKYQAIDYSVADLESVAGAPIALSDDRVTIMMGRTREPSLSLHGIEGAYSGVGGKTVIPSTVSGKFSLRYECFVSVLFILLMTWQDWFLLKHQKTSPRKWFHILRMNSQN